jgi:hypothetical protein
MHEDWPIVHRVRGTAASAACGDGPRLRAGSRVGAVIAVPLALSETAEHLRSQSYDCKPQMLELLVESGIVRVSPPNAWTRMEVDAAADCLQDAEILTRPTPRCGGRWAAGTPISCGGW